MKNRNFHYFFSVITCTCLSLLTDMLLEANEIFPRKVIIFDTSINLVCICKILLFQLMLYSRVYSSLFFLIVNGKTFVIETYSKGTLLLLFSPLTCSSHIPVKMTQALIISHELSLFAISFSYICIMIIVRFKN